MRQPVGAFQVHIRLAWHHKATAAGLQVYYSAAAAAATNTRTHTRDDDDGRDGRHGLWQRAAGWRRRLRRRAARS